jgi:tRNA threonylcarbamoyladenosine biosynthesis protein TsaB
MLLALDTSTRNISIALHDGAQVIAEHTWHSLDNHTIELAPAVQRMLKQARIALHTLAGVAVALGPGSFTGLRIGLGLAKGLALAHRTPLVGVPTLEALAHAQPPRPEPMVALLQAGRGRIALAVYRYREGGWHAEGAPRLSDWAALASDTLEPTYFCGEIDAAGAEALRRIKRRAIVPSPAFALRRAAYLAELAWVRLRANSSDAPETLAPLYLSYAEAAAP